MSSPPQNTAVKTESKPVSPYRNEVTAKSTKKSSSPEPKYKNDYVSKLSGN